MGEKATGELESMAQQLFQLHATVAQLKEELKEEKKKAKQEAEDLTQEMAELRYQFLEMLEQERELRAHTEQASLTRIEELEVQRQHERRQLLIALDCYHEAEKVAEAKAKEIEQLKFSLDKMEAMINELAKIQEQDKRHIENLELELKTSSDYLGKLQEEINVKQLEANLVAKHVQCLEIKLVDSDKLHEKITYLEEKLAKSETERLDLKQELEDKKVELQHATDCIRRLEYCISENSMQFEFEIESMRQMLVDSEQRCIEVNKTCEEQTEEEDRLLALINSLNNQLEKARHAIDRLQEGHAELHEDLAKSETKVTHFCLNQDERLDQWFSEKNATDHASCVNCVHSATNLIRNRLLLDRQSSNTKGGDKFLFSKPITVKNMEEKATEELGSTAQQLSQLHAVVAQLKDELREEKKKAKEEAEDLTQEMAELRYQLMEMLEQEREIRAHTEQASLHRVEELEVQRQQEREQLLIAVRRYHEAEKVAEAEAKEIEQLKRALDRMKKLELDKMSFQSMEVHFQREHADSSSQAEWLHEDDNEKYVDLLIQYEEEHGRMKAKEDASKKSSGPTC